MKYFVYIIYSKKFDRFYGDRPRISIIGPPGTTPAGKRLQLPTAHGNLVDRKTIQVRGDEVGVKIEKSFEGTDLGLH